MKWTPPRAATNQNHQSPYSGGHTKGTGESESTGRYLVRIADPTCPASLDTHESDHLINCGNTEDSWTQMAFGVADRLVQAGLSTHLLVKLMMFSGA